MLQLQATVNWMLGLDLKLVIERSLREAVYRYIYRLYSMHERVQLSIWAHGWLHLGGGSPQRQACWLLTCFLQVILSNKSRQPTTATRQLHAVGVAVVG